jgi:hypothetical protein
MLYAVLLVIVVLDKLEPQGVTASACTCAYLVYIRRLVNVTLVRFLFGGGLWPLMTIVCESPRCKN